MPLNPKIRRWYADGRRQDWRARMSSRKARMSRLSVHLGVGANEPGETLFLRVGKPGNGFKRSCHQFQSPRYAGKAPASARLACRTEPGRSDCTRAAGAGTAKLPSIATIHGLAMRTPAFRTIGCIRVLHGVRSLACRYADPLQESRWNHIFRR